MRLVDGDQGDPPPRQSLQRSLAKQPLGREIEQIEPAGLELRRDPRGLCGSSSECSAAAAHAELAQRRNLVVHQRDQRRDDDGRARPGRAPAPGSTGSCRRRSASAPARRLPARPRAHRALLQPAEVVEAEHPAQNVAGRLGRTPPKMNPSVMRRRGFRPAGFPARDRRQSVAPRANSWMRPTARPQAARAGRRRSGRGCATGSRVGLGGAWAGPRAATVDVEPRCCARSKHGTPSVAVAAGSSAVAPLGRTARNSVALVRVWRRSCGRSALRRRSARVEARTRHGHPAAADGASAAEPPDTVEPLDPDRRRTKADRAAGGELRPDGS